MNFAVFLEDFFSYAYDTILSFILMIGRERCSWSCLYSCLLRLPAPFTDSLSMYVQEPLVIGGKGYSGRDLSEKSLAADNGC
jgi:hypothetical protein